MIWKGVAGVLLAAALLPSWATYASAGWSASGGGTARVVADVMTNADDFVATCTTDAPDSTVELSWTVSPDPYVTDYEITRSGAGMTTTTVVSATTSSTVDSPPTIPGATYSYTIRARASEAVWTTAPVGAVGTPSYTAEGCTSA